MTGLSPWLEEFIDSLSKQMFREAPLGCQALI